MAVALSTLAVHAGTGATGPVQWTDASWDEVLKQAKVESKHIFIDFYATWCGPCKRMDKNTFTDPSVASFLNANIPVKLDAEKGLGEELAQEYRVSAYPTFVLIGPDGKEVDRHIGYLDPEPFLKVMEGYVRGEGTVAWYENKLREDPDDIETRRTLGIKLADAVLPEEAETHLNKVLEMDPDDERGWHADIVYALGDVNYRAERYDQARKHFERLITEIADSERYEEGLTLLARVEHKLGNSDAAVAHYQTYLDRHPDDPRAMNAFAWFCSQRGIGLDRALPVALKAAELSNRDPGILDTLAEVYFAMGDYDNAIEIGKECVAAEPDDTYFQNQVKKYQKAKQEAGSRAAG
jgi:tetratricopeptide (TPR) repeat protein